MYALCFVPGDVDKSDGAGKENGADGAEGGDGEETEEQAAEPEQEEDEDGIHPGDILITGSADGTARSWALATGKQLKVGPAKHRNACLLTGIGAPRQLRPFNNQEHQYGPQPLRADYRIWEH